MVGRTTGGPTCDTPDCEETGTIIEYPDGPVSCPVLRCEEHARDGEGGGRQ